MKKISTIFLQGVVVVLGLGIFVALLVEPQFEGVNLHSTLFEIYFKDPFLAYVYLGSVPFFVALWQAYKILGYVRENNIFSLSVAKSLQTIKYAMSITAIAIVGADIFIKLTSLQSGDDPAGALALSFIAICISIVTAVIAGLYERIVQDVIHKR